VEAAVECIGGVRCVEDSDVARGAHGMNEERATGGYVGSEVSSAGVGGVGSFAGDGK
jgi:hypothetical protein